MPYHVNRLDKIRRMLWRKASRDWPCKFCSLPIRKGEHYWDGGTPAFRAHPECAGGGQPGCDCEDDCDCDSWLDPPDYPIEAVS